MTDLNMGETLWAWVTEVEGGGVSLVAVALPGLPASLPVMPLIGRSEKVLRAAHIEAAARAHGSALGQKVWLRRYTLAEEIGK